MCCTRSAVSIFFVLQVFLGTSCACCCVSCFFLVCFLRRKKPRNTSVEDKKKRRNAFAIHDLGTVRRTSSGIPIVVVGDDGAFQTNLATICREHDAESQCHLALAQCGSGGSDVPLTEQEEHRLTTPCMTPRDAEQRVESAVLVQTLLATPSAPGCSTLASTA